MEYTDADGNDHGADDEQSPIIWMAMVMMMMMMMMVMMMMLMMLMHVEHDDADGDDKYGYDESVSYTHLTLPTNREV